MEHLTKAQIVLLTLFVSFVASMATGIVVVTLMQQSPEPVSSTITRVVEHTIEKITPTIVNTTNTKTVVIKDEDLVVSAIDRNLKSTVAFKASIGDGGVLSAGVGTIVSSDGLVITDRWNLGLGKLYTTINGVQYSLDVISNSEENILGLGRLVPVSATTTPAFPAVSFISSASAIKIGQTTIVLGGRDGKTVSTGIIMGLDTHTVTDKETKVETIVLDNIGVSTRFASVSNGAPIINLNGEVVGFMSINESAGSQSGVPFTEAQELINSIVKTSEEKNN